MPMLDGGIADSIPVEYALSQGYERLVVILTRNKGYRKKESKMRAAELTALYQDGYDIALSLVTCNQ